MSEQEEVSKIGALVKERADARRRYALLNHDLAQVADRLSTVAACMRDATIIESWTRGVQEMNALIAVGGLDALKTKALDLGSLSVRISEITATLRAAGVE